MSLRVSISLTGFVQLFSFSSVSVQMLMFIHGLINATKEENDQMFGQPNAGCFGAHRD